MARSAAIVRGNVKRRIGVALNPGWRRSSGYASAFAEAIFAAGAVRNQATAAPVTQGRLLRVQVYRAYKSPWAKPVRELQPVASKRILPNRKSHGGRTECGRVDFLAVQQFCVAC